VADLESKLDEIARIKVEAEKSRRQAEERVENVTKESIEKV
jgi:hypothetical protein